MPEGYSPNDWFFTKSDSGSVCDSANRNASIRSDCQQNQKTAKTYYETKSNLGASSTKYSELLMLYNRELLTFFNLVVGLLLMCYYIYLNKNVLSSSVSTAVEKTTQLASNIRSSTPLK